MFEVRVESDFAAAHFLKDYHGKCENLHGHNYAVFAHARGTQLDDGGMLLDFGIWKTALGSVCKKLDHSNLNDLYENGQSVFNNNPSAERIAKWIFEKMTEELVEAERNIKGDLIKNETDISVSELLYAVDVFETPTSRARYIK